MMPHIVEAFTDCDELLRSEGIRPIAFHRTFEAFLQERGVNDFWGMPADAIRSYVSQYVGLIRLVNPESINFIYRKEPNRNDET